MLLLRSGAAQVAPQLIPAELLVTVPLPVLVTVRVKAGPKLAVTVLAAVMATLHSLGLPDVGVQPAHLTKVEPAAGVAVRVAVVGVTVALLRKAAMQSLPQLIPVGTLVTVPLPVPTFVAVRV